MSYETRMARVRERMAASGVDALCCAAGPDLTYLTGYEAVPLERLTMLVVPRNAEAVLVVAAIEAPRVLERPSVFRLDAWTETEDPIAEVAALIGGAGGQGVVAVSDHTWARFVLALQAALPEARFTRATSVTGPLRAVKDDAEIAALRAAAQVVDHIAVSLRDEPFAGRTEREVHRAIADRMLDAGHDHVNFAIVASGPNAASPHHEPGARVIEDGDVVLCDFGGSMRHYCSDITRMFVVGRPGSEVLEAYAALVEAQEAGVRAATVGTPCAEVDAAARGVLADAGLSEWFIHRTGHGIGLEAHEDPYVVAGNETALVAGHAFSVEPGLYFPGRFGLRLEDIVVATDAGPLRCNDAPRDLAIVT